MASPASYVADVFCTQSYFVPSTDCRVRRLHDGSNKDAAQTNVREKEGVHYQENVEQIVTGSDS